MRIVTRILMMWLVSLAPLASQPWPVLPLPPTPPLAAPPQAPPGSFQFYAQAAPSGGPYLGVGLLEIDVARAKDLGLETPQGVEISSIVKESPADEAGLKQGDVILEFRGQPVMGVEHFIRLVRETPVGREVPLTLWRQKARTTLTVPIGRRKSAEKSTYFWCNEGESDCEVHFPDVRFHLPTFEFDIPRPRMMTQSRYLGIEIESVEGQLAEFFGGGGLLVRSVDANSLAARAGLQAGDVIVSVEGKPVKDAGDLRTAIQSAPADKQVDIDVMRNKSKTTLHLEPRKSDEDRQGFRGRRIRGPRGERL